MKKYSYPGIKTDMQSILQEGGQGFEEEKRAILFDKYTSNHSVMMLDKDSEEFFMCTTPLSGLDALLSSAQEQIATASGIPGVKFMGSTPTGMNASTDGEIEVFYDKIKSKSELHLAALIRRMLDVLQLSELGEIDPDITFDFVPLKEMTEKETAEINKIKAETDALYIGAGILSPEEPRARLAYEKDSHYDGIDPDQTNAPY